MKINKVVKIILLSLLILVLFGIMIYGIDSMNGFGYNVDCGGISDMRGYTTLDKEITENVSELEINWISGNIEISSSSEITKIIVEEKGYTKESDRLVYKIENGKLKIDFYKTKFRLFNNHSISKDLKIVVPKNINGDLATLNIDSVSAEVEIKDIKIPYAQIETVSGKVVTNNADFKTLDIESVSGYISVQGNVQKLLIETVSGSVLVDTDEDVKEIKTETVSGNIKLNLKGDEGFNASFETVSGKFTCEFPTTFSKKAYVYADGTNAYKFETISGDVSILKK